MPPQVDITVVWNFATALLIGALLGIERERHKREHDELDDRRLAHVHPVSR